MPSAIRHQYQYFTQAKVENLRRAGYNAGFTPLEEGGYRYVTLFLNQPERDRGKVPAPSATTESAMLNFEDALKLIPEQTIVCVGDLMLDDFVYGEVSRISPEAPAPILAVRRNELTVGGAGNVARNIAGLGARCVFLSVVGEDDASRTLMRAL